MTTLFAPAPVAAPAASQACIAFRVFGIPKAQPRPRAWVRVINGKPTARVYDAGTAEAWKGDVARKAEEHRPPAPLDGPVRLDVDFIFPRPKSLLRRKDPEGRLPHVAKPDRDNCEKALLDCLKTLGFFTDDCQVCAGEPRKFYAAKGELSGAVVWIQLGGPDAPDPRQQQPHAAAGGR
jgi:crossover junction endodeoxyribonuclease RusA